MLLDSTRSNLVLGYASGRVEIRRLAGLADVAAVGYTVSRPNSLTLSDRAEGKFLVVSAGELVWFKLPSF